MKTKTIVFSLMCLLVITAKAQYTDPEDSPENSRSLYFGAGLGGGLFYPKGINNYLKDQYSTGQTVKLYTQYIAFMHLCLFILQALSK